LAISPDSIQHKRSRRGGLAEAFDHVPPCQIIGKITSGDAMKAAYPVLEAAVASIDILNVKDAVPDTHAGPRVKRFMIETNLSGGEGERTYAVAAEQSVRRDAWLNGFVKIRGRQATQDGMGGITRAITHDQDRNPLTKGCAARC